MQMSQKLMVTCTIGALLATPAVSVYAQDLTPVTQAAAKGDLSEAMRLARQIIAQSPNAPVAHQVLGILLVADGQIPAAAIEFRLACEQGPKLKPTPTGLEALNQRGTALYEALNRQKALFALEAGIAAARNNLGATKIVLNKTDDGLNDIDAAAGARPDWAAPWVNGALAWVIKHKPQKVRTSGQKALDLGERGARIYTILAESAIQLHRYSQAEIYLDAAKQQDADYPYALYVQSMLKQATGSREDATRDYLRALALAPGVAAEGRFTTLFDRIGVGGGNQNEDHQYIKLNGQPSGWTYQLNLQRDSLQVADRTGAFQRRNTTDFTLGRSTVKESTALTAHFVAMNGGVPGATDSAFGNKTPGATFDYNSTGINLVQRWNTDQKTRLLFNAAYRHNGVGSETNSTSTLPVSDDQWNIATSFDRLLDKKTELRAGLSWFQNQRATSGATTFPVLSPVEPNDQVTPVGTYATMQAYVVAEHRLSDRTHGAIGAEYGSFSGSTFLLPYADLTVRLTQKQSLHFTIHPSLFGSGQDLSPIPMAGSIVSNPIDRRSVRSRSGNLSRTRRADLGAANANDQQGTATQFINQSPLLPGLTGRALNYEISWITAGRGGSEFTLKAYHRRIADYFSVNGDPRLSSILPLMDVPQGETTGLEARTIWPLPGGFALSVTSRYQNSHAIPSVNFISAARTSIALDNTPQWQNSLNLSWADRYGWVVAVDAHHVGARTEQPPFDSSGLLKAPDVTTVNLHVTRRLTDRYAIFLNAYQLTGNSFYPGYPAGRSVVVGFTSSL